MLTASKALAEYYEVVADVSRDPKIAANWVMGELAGLLKAASREIEDSPVPAKHLGELVALIVKAERRPRCVELDVAWSGRSAFRFCAARARAGWTG